MFKPQGAGPKQAVRFTTVSWPWLIWQTLTYSTKKCKMDTLGFEPRAFRMRSGCDTTTPRALEKKRRKTLVFALLCYSRLGSSDRHWGVPIHVLATLQGVCWLAKITKRIGSCTCARCKKAKCRDPGSNRGPSDLQSDALPTELSRLCLKCEAQPIKEDDISY